jgi:hypothetical protein
MSLELICGNMGLLLGLPLFGAIYFAVAFGINYGIWAAGLSGLLLDAIYCRSVPLSALIYAGIVMLCFQSAVRVERQLPAAPAVSGALCGFLIWVWHLFYSWGASVDFPGPDIFSMVVFQVSGGALLMLVMTLFFDALNFRCNLPKFVSAENRNSIKKSGRIRP